MKKFLSKLAIFGTPFLVALILMFAFPLNREYAYAYASKDSDPFPYVYNRVHVNPNPIDWAFIGSSRTMAAVNDRRVEQTLKDTYQITEGVANLGINRNGRNLHWVLAGHLFEKKAPQALILEVQAIEPIFSHFDFAYVASAQQLLLATPSKSYVPDIFDATEVRFLYYRDFLLGNVEDSIPEPDLRDHSYLEFDSVTVADSALLADFQYRRTIRPPEDLPQTSMEEFNYWWRYSFPKAYLERIVELCEENQVQLIFLYVPGYGMPIDEPVDLNYYEARGEVWIPPDSLYRKQRNWHDPNHLSFYGAQELSDWVAGKISRK